MIIARVSAHRYFPYASLEGKISSVLLLWAAVLTEMKGMNSMDFCYCDSVWMKCIINILGTYLPMDIHAHKALRNLVRTDNAS